jgi:predicted nucleic acid-binding protein
MAKIVIDANVIISAAFGGKPFEAVARAMGDHEVYSSETTKRELQGVIVSLGEKNPRLEAKTLVCTRSAGRFDS